ncbi:BCCT family transporter, partial [Bacillus paranthracis]|uniref:glycine betaine transporter OpuD n=1 Tax=Bacillus paranthracis TaxID=2026186 RepID=UPI002E2359F1|nr:BCCT family transporter [Bacillus paranthracis]
GALWFSVFGGTGIHMELFDDANIYGQIKEMGTEVGLFAMLDQMGSMGPALCVLAILLISTFFITSADSATFVLGMLTTHGSLNPPNRIKMIWGIVLAAIASTLLYIGGLEALQTAAIIAAFPFVFVIFFMMAALFKELQKEGRMKRH